MSLLEKVIWEHCHALLPIVQSSGRRISPGIEYAHHLLGNMLQTVVECLWPITPSMGRVEESCWLLHHDRDKSFGLGTPLSVVLWYVHSTWNPLPVWDGKSVMVFSRQLTWKQQKSWIYAALRLRKTFGKLKNITFESDCRKNLWTSRPRWSFCKNGLRLRNVKRWNKT